MPLRKITDSLKLHLPLPDVGPGDDELHSTYPKPKNYRPAAVLVPLVLVNGAVEVLLTERSADLQHHPGQIGFPGGRIEEADADAVAAALREAHEEIALPMQQVDVIGTLPAYPTRSGFMITPVVGTLDALPPLAADSNEVARIFTVPLQFFSDPANCRVDRLQFDGYTHEFYAFDTTEGLVWGATAGIIVNLTRLLA